MRTRPSGPIFRTPCEHPTCPRQCMHRFCCTFCHMAWVEGHPPAHTGTCNARQRRYAGEVPPPKLWSGLPRWRRGHMPAKGTSKSGHRKKDAPPAKAQDCLRCDRIFQSEGPHNRLCTSCRNAIAQETEGLPRARIPGLRRLRSTQL
jgi:hypothetical protein